MAPLALLLCLLAISETAAGPAFNIHPYGTLTMPSSQKAQHLAFSGDGHYLVGVSSLGSVAVWNADNKTEIYRQSGRGRLLFADFLSNAEDVVLVNEEGQVSILNLLNRQAPQNFAARSQPRIAAMDAGRRYLALINKKNQIELYDLKARMPAGVIEGGSDFKHAIYLGFDRLGQRVIVISERAKVYAWNPVNLNLLQQYWLGGYEWAGSSSTIHAASSNRSANTFIVGLEEVAIPKGGLQGLARPTDLMRTNTIIAYDFQSGSEQKRVKFPENHVTHIAMGPGNDHAVITPYDQKEIHLLDFRQGEFICRFPLEQTPTAVAVSEDDKYLATALANGQVAVWLISGGEFTSGSSSSALQTGLGARIRAIDDLGPALPADKSVTLAILDFKSPESQRDLGQGCLELLSAQLANVPHITLVERSRIEDIVDELSLSMSGLTEQEGVQIGKLLDADYVLFGGISKFGNTNTFTARIVNVSTGQIEAARGVIAEECRDQDVVDAIVLLAKLIAG
jgi:TolB-like protein